MEEKKASTDLTTGPITARLVMFALPIIAGNIVQQLYNVADSVVVGRFVGSQALAAVTVSGPVMMLFNSLFMGFAMGGNILVAQYRGAKQYDALERTVNTTFAMSFIMGTIITVLGLLLSKSLLRLLGTPEDILDSAADYLKIVFLGMIGTIVYNLSNGMTRGFGDSKTPLYVLTFSCCLNISLDLIFVINFGWGVVGAAVATSIATILSGIYLFSRFLRGTYSVKVSFAQMRQIDWGIVKLTLKLGLPSAIQNSVMSLGNMIMQTFSNLFGSSYIAANGIINQVDGFAMLPMMGISMANTTFVGQNIGAGQVDRAKKGMWNAVIICTCIAVVMGFLINNFGIGLIHIYTDNETVLEIGRTGLTIMSFFLWCMGINQCVSGAMRGAGAATMPALISIITNILVRIPTAYMLSMVPYNRDISEAVSSGLYATTELAAAAGVGFSRYIGLFYTRPINMVLSAVLILLYYKFGKWQTKSVTGKLQFDDV